MSNNHWSEKMDALQMSPSATAWGKLEDQLDNQEEKQLLLAQYRLRYRMAAASVVLIFFSAAVLLLLALSNNQADNSKYRQVVVEEAPSPFSARDIYGTSVTVIYEGVQKATLQPRERKNG
jgi:hypothetical protein